MVDRGSRFHFNSPRAERLVDAWNAGDTDHIVAQLADSMVLEARLPKIPVPAANVTLPTKAAFVAALASYRGTLPRFVIVSAMEDPHTICLVLEDPDRHLLAVTIELDEEGLFSRIISFRPDR